MSKEKDKKIAVSEGAGSEQKGNEESTKKKKKKGIRVYKPVHLLVPFTLLVTVLIVGYCLTEVLVTFQDSGAPLIQNGNDIEWPSFVGIDEAQAKTTLEADPYKTLVKEYVYEYDADTSTIGKVISQKPSPKVIKSTQKVVITINQGAQDITVPDVLGKTRDEVKKAFAEVGIVPYFQTVYDTSGVLGEVVGTEPSFGQTVKNIPGENKVLVNIAGQKIGQQTVTVPSLVGLESLGEAQTAASKLNLDIVVTEVAAEEGQVVGTIVSQSPVSGTSVKAFSTIRITVAVDPAVIAAEAEAAAAEAAAKAESAAAAAAAAAG